MKSDHATGAFRHRITVERREDVPDGTGAFVTQWLAVRKVWARLLSGSARPFWEAQQAGHTLAATIIMRWRSDVVPGMRLRFGPRVFAVTAIRDDDGMQRLLICECEEIRT